MLCVRELQLGASVQGRRPAKKKAEGGCKRCKSDTPDFLASTIWYAVGPLINGMKGEGQFGGETKRRVT